MNSKMKLTDLNPVCSVKHEFNSRVVSDRATLNRVASTRAAIDDVQRARRARLSNLSKHATGQANIVTRTPVGGQRESPGRRRIH